MRRKLSNVPVAEGYKLFYICCGNVVQTITVKESSKEVKEQFVKSVRACHEKMPCKSFEKESVDFQDIIYSELQNAKEELNL